MNEEKQQTPKENGTVEGFPDINADENISGTAHLNDPLEEESESEKLREELEQTKDKYLRLVAEFDNFRKRTSRERLETLQTAGKEIIGELLEVLDDYSRAEAQMKEAQDVEQVKEGVSLIFAKLKNKLNARGLKPMDSLHQDFDADKHEAITEIPVEDEKLKGKVVDEVMKGYYLNDKIIRHAKVVVGK